MLRRNSLRATQLREMNRAGSDFISKKGLANTATRYAQSAPFTKTVKGGNTANISVQSPVGAPQVPIQVANPMPIEDSVTITIDTTGLGKTLAKQKVWLFDEGGFYQKEFGASANPAGVVYIESPTADKYNPYVGGLCGKSYHYDLLVMQVHAAADATATAEMQFLQSLNRYSINVDEMRRKKLHLRNFVDGYQQNPNVRVIPLNPEIGRIDRHVAYDAEFFHGLVTTLTFYQFAHVRD